MVIGLSVRKIKATWYTTGGTQSARKCLHVEPRIKIFLINCFWNCGFIIEDSDSHTYQSKQQILRLHWKHTAIKFLPPFNPTPLLTAYRLPGSSSLSTSPLPVQLRNTCDLRDLGEFSFTWNSNTCLLFLFWMDVGMIASPLTLL